MELQFLLAQVYYYQIIDKSCRLFRVDFFENKAVINAEFPKRRSYTVFGNFEPSKATAESLVKVKLKLFTKIFEPPLEQPQSPNQPHPR